ncbi:uncharacterized protein V1518DRAFT_410656 [Limtongia smithiae]|uniref:uncharacterized protein n=1 Tax=Limtongia smithiae TaxID=1125753 RepID=UPI0034CE478D
MSAVARLAKLIEAWPQDALHRRFDFKAVLGEQLEQYKQPPATTTPGTPSASGDLPPIATQIQGMQELLDDKAFKKFPLTDKMLKPQGHPDYYDKLRAELANGPSEPTRWDRVKMFFLS